MTTLAHANPTLKLKPLIKPLYAQSSDFKDRHERVTRPLVFASANVVVKGVDKERNKVHEMYQPLETIYEKIRTFCKVDDVLETIQKFAKTCQNRSKQTNVS